MSFTLPFYTLIFRNSSFSCVDSQTLSDTVTMVSNQLQKPPMYKVLMLNDDFTPMDFVVYILETIFQKNSEEAVKTMLEVHNNGIGNCGVFTYEVAETKQEQALQLAKNHQYPLQCVLEKE